MVGAAGGRGAVIETNKGSLALIAERTKLDFNNEELLISLLFRISEFRQKDHTIPVSVPPFLPLGWIFEGGVAPESFRRVRFWCGGER